MNNIIHDGIERKTRFLGVGEVTILEQPTTVHTILGSCIAVIFHCPRLRLSAICHAQMPENRKYKTQCADSCPHPCFKELGDSYIYKFVSCSINYMISEMNKRGAMNIELEACILGGASIIKSLENYSIGALNLELALKMINDLKINIIYNDSGGRSARSFYYFSDINKIAYR